MKTINKVLVLLLVFGLAGACDNLKMEDLQVNPNSPSPENASLNDLYNSVQLGFKNVFQSSQYNPGSAARMYQWVAYNYGTMTTNTTYNGLWGNAYNGLFPDIDALLLIAEDGGFNIHAGSAKIMKAYVLMVMVDLLGDVPYTEAGQGTDVISPSTDTGASVYAAAIAMLDDAITDLTGTTASKPAYDNFYGGDPDKWIKAANTLKLRAALNTGDVATINSLVSGGNLISSSSEDFQWTYGNNRTNPNTRHPQYNEHYETGDGNYLSNYFMWMLKAEKESVLSPGTTITDPRIRYYFYRKVSDAIGQDPTTYSCHFSNLPDAGGPETDPNKPAHWDSVDPRLPYCVCSADGYSGRDHLNGEGIPPDGPTRTSWGLYPFGGDFDDDTFVQTNKASTAGTLGAQGAGIAPLMTSSFVDFMVAEAVLRLGATGDAQALMLSGISKSLNKVEGFESKVAAKMGKTVTLKDGSTGTIRSLFGLSKCVQDDGMGNCLKTAKEQYLEEVDAIYGAASNKLDVVIKEFYIAAWGNGLEAYNMYRRTGYPGNMQPSLELDPGQFPLSFLYPSNSTDRNSNIVQKDNLGVSVFWQDPAIASTLY